MKYETAAALRRAIEDRLRDPSSGQSIAHRRKIIVFERFLARLLAVAPSHWVLKSFVLDATRIQTALKTVFENRGSHALPVKLPAPPDWWERGMSRIMRDMGRDESLGEVYALASRFIDPVLEGSVDGRWDPGEWTWGRTEP